MLGEARVKYPINIEKLKNVANDRLLHGSMSCTFDESEHILLREMPAIQKPCGPPPKRGGLPPTLPEAVTIPSTFLIERNFCGKELNIVIFERNMSEMSSSVIGGSQATDHEGIVLHAKTVVKGWIVAGMRKSQPHESVKGLVFKGSIRDQTVFENSANDLVQWTYNRLTSSEQNGTVLALEKAMKDHLINLPKTQETTDILPQSVVVKDFPFKRQSAGENRNFASVDHHSADETLAPFVCREKGETLLQHLSLQQMKTAMEQYSMEIRVAENCGTNDRIKEASWCALKKVHYTDDSFTVSPLSNGSLEEGQKTRLLMTHFEHKHPLDGDFDDDLPLEG